MTTVSALATLALGDEFAASRQGEAERYVAHGISKIYRQTNLARGGSMTSTSTLAGALTLAGAGLTTLVGARVDGLVHQDNGDQLTELDSNIDIRSLQLAQPARGRPLYYRVIDTDAVGSEGPAIALWPIPDKVYTLLLENQREPGPLQLTGASVVPLPEPYEEAIEAYVKWHLFANDSDLEMATYWEGQWTTECKELRGDLQRKTTKNRRVPGTWSRMGESMPSFHYPGLF